MSKVLEIKTVVRDGFHNMLTAIAYWEGYYWLAYRRVSTHYAPDGIIIILKSLDLKRWHEVATINPPGNHWIPKFCVAGNRLFLSFHTTNPRLSPRDETGAVLTKSQTYPDIISQVCYSDDGIKWTNPQKTLTNQVLYQMRLYNGVFYATGMEWEQEIHEYHHGPLNMLRSDDGLNWKKISTITGLNDNPDEADIWFQPDGEAWVISRTFRKPQHSIFFSSRPPYKEWKRIDLKTTIHCPCFCECDGQLYVTGRRAWDELWIPQSMCPPGNTAIWTVERGKVKPFQALPSNGDSAYPGIISTEPGKIIISFYSQHAYTSGIIPWKIKPRSFDIGDLWQTDDDIFIGEIAVE